MEALRILAGSPEGATEALLAAHGVSIDTMVALVKAGLATAHVDQLARPRIEVARLVITDAGHAAVERTQA